MRCAEISLAAGEPLAGTAVANTDRWLVLEHAAPWGPLGVEDSGLPAAVVEQLAELGRRHPRMRVQLVRRRDVSAGVKLYLADCTEPALFGLTLARVEDLLALDLDGWLRGEVALGEREHEPLYLVCVHGKRDRCCALLGLPVYRALSEQVGERALETTHLGGHRFAATLMVLPYGACYGRVEPEHAPALVSASRRGEWFELAHARGRSSYGSEAQAAEIALRMQTGELALARYRFEGLERASDSFSVRFTDAGESHVVQLKREAMPAMPTSCDGEPKPVKRLLALERHALE
jgi:hypothetical protein